MAHRGPMREMFGLLCMAVIVPRVHKSAIPKGNTGYIIDAEDNDIQNITVSHFTPPPATSFQPFLLSFLASVFSLLGDEVISMVATWMLANALFPSIVAIKRLILWAFRPRGRINHGDATHTTHQNSSSENGTAGAHDTANGDASNKARESTPSSSKTAGAYDTANEQPTYKTRQFTPSQTTTAKENDDEWFDAEQLRPSQEDSPDNTPSLPTQDQVLAELRAESAEKDVRIATLNQAAEQHSSTITRLNRREGHLLGSLRSALDPEGLYATTTDVVLIANDVAHDLSRASKKLERQNNALEEARARQENGQLAQKDGEISRLSTENSRLNTRIGRLEDQQRQSALELETDKQAARKTEKRLKDRTLAAESAANQAISQRQYDIVRSQLEDVVTELRQMKSEAADVQGHFNTELQAEPQSELQAELQAERTRVQELRITADNAVEAQQQSESLLTTAKRELQLANEKIANTTSEALAQIQEARDAEDRARAAEEKDGQNTAAMNELQQNLREARDQAEKLRESNERVALKLQQTEKMVEEKGETNGAAPNEKLIAEITGLQSELIEVRNKAFQSGYLQAISENPSPAEPTDPENNPIYVQGYNRAVEDCGVQAEGLVQAAVNEKVQEVKDSLTQQWLHQETEWRLNFDAEVEDKAAERVKSLREELSAAVRRAIVAEDKARNPEAQLAEAQKDARDMYASYGTLWAEAGVQKERIQELEGEVAKYKEGKANQDKRIKKLHDDIAEAKRSIPQHPELKAAEAKAMENDSIRATALINEMMRRHYDHPTRYVLRELVKANGMITAFKLHLQKPATRSNQEQFLKKLANAEVDKTCLEKLDTTLRLVLKKQCAAVNAKIMALREIVGQSKAPDKNRLLEEIWKPRGDEEVEWGESEAVPSSDSDEDQDDKGREAHNAEHGTRLESQHLPSSERIGEATAPQTQSNNQTSVGPQWLGPTSFSTQQFAPDNTTPAIWSGTPPKAGYPVYSKPNKVSRPRPKAHLKPSVRKDLLDCKEHLDKEAALAQAAARPSVSWPIDCSFSAPKNVASAVVANPTPAEQNHGSIFSGLSLLGAVMADKKSALPGLPPPEDEVLEFDSAPVAEDKESDPEPDDEFPAHTAPGDEEDDETIWENALYSSEQDGDFGTNNGDDMVPSSTIRALDMTEQNYEDQAAEAEAAMQGIKQDPPAKNPGQPQGEEPEDNFHVDIDHD